MKLLLKIWKYINHSGTDQIPTELIRKGNIYVLRSTALK